jgi:coproporphyrinogen III oxidase-like Fe-S oxidoreductase
MDELVKTAGGFDMQSTETRIGSTKSQRSLLAKFHFPRCQAACGYTFFFNHGQKEGKEKEIERLHVWAFA